MFRKIKLIILSVVILLCSINQVFAVGSSEEQVKRIISVVYDDSYSMTKSTPYPNKQDDQYAMYALENVIGFTNDNDEVNIVRMSDKNSYKTYGVSNINEKKSSINEVASWGTYANETPFQAVETAISFLKEKKEQYGTGDNIEYWLLVLTDGDLEGMPADVVEYYNNIKSDMADVKFESVWIFIGNSIRSGFPETIKSIQGTNVIYSGNDKEICEAVFKACEIIYGRTSLVKEKLNLSSDGKTVKFNLEFPINKIIIYEQNQNIGLNSIVGSDNKKYTDFSSIETEKKVEPQIKSRIIQMSSNNVIPAGEVTLNFDDVIDISDDKFMLMVDWAIGLKLGYINKDGVFSTGSTSEFGDGENVNFVTKVINLYDNSEIDLSNKSNKIKATYEYDGKTNVMSYDSVEKNYKFVNSVKLGNNPFSSKLVYEGYFRLKSQPVNIYVPSVPTVRKITPTISPSSISVSKKHDDYEKVGTENITFDGLTSDEKVSLEFSNVPNGIQLKVNGSKVNNNKVSTTAKGSQKLIIDIYRNKDYKGENTSVVETFIKFKENSFNDRLTTSNLSFSIVPKERALALNISTVEGIDPNNLSSNKAYGKNLYYVKPMIDGANISKDELKKSSIEFKTDLNKTKSKIKYKIVDKDGENGFYIYLKGPINKLNCAESFIFTTTLTTPFNERVSSDKVIGTNEATSIRIKSNPIPFILSILGIILFIWFVIGLFKKARFECKRHKIIVCKNGSEISNAPIKVDGLSKLIPYKPETGMAYDLKVIASDSKRAIYVDKKSLQEGMEYNSDILSKPFRKNLKMNEDMPLINTDSSGKTVYTYTDVVTGGGNATSDSSGLYGGKQSNKTKTNNAGGSSTSSKPSSPSASGPWG